jgi:hypothetical protein
MQQQQKMNKPLGGSVHVCIYQPDHNHYVAFSFLKPEPYYAFDHGARRAAQPLTLRFFHSEFLSCMLAGG